MLVICPLYLLLLPRCHHGFELCVERTKLQPEDLLAVFASFHLMPQLARTAQDIFQVVKVWGINCMISGFFDFVTHHSHLILPGHPDGINNAPIIATLQPFSTPPTIIFRLLLSPY